MKKKIVNIRVFFPMPTVWIPCFILKDLAAGSRFRAGLVNPLSRRSRPFPLLVLGSHLGQEWVSFSEIFLKNVGPGALKNENGGNTKVESL